MNDQPAEELKTENGLGIRRKGFLLADALVIAVVSAISYLMSFFYERSYLGFWGLPSDFVIVDVTRILQFAAGSIAVLIIIFAVANSWSPVLLKFPQYLRHFIPLYAAMVLFGLVVPLLATNPSSWLIVSAIVTLILVGFLLFLRPLIIHRDKPGLLARYEIAKPPLLVPRPNLVNELTDRFGSSALLTVACLLVGAGLAAMAGEFEARRTRRFLVTDTNPSLVVLRVYGETAICAEYDAETKITNGSFRVIKLTDHPEMKMTLSDIGPLKGHESK